MEPESRRGDPTIEVWKPWLALASLPFLMAVMAILLLLRFDMFDPIVRPLALTFGRPASALVSSKRVSHGRYAAGNYVELNFQYSADYAPRPEMKVNGAAYEALIEGSTVAIHYLQGCPSCIALDKDYGSARQQAVLFFSIVLFSVGAVFFQYYFRR